MRRERPAIEAVVSYSDAQAGHIGRVYAALSGAHRGRTAARTVLRAGSVTIPGRTVSKIRGAERGHEGAVDKLVGLGMPRPAYGETLADWRVRLQREGHLSRHVQSGLFTYCFELSREARRRGRLLPRLPYPRVLALTQPDLSALFSSSI